MHSWALTLSALAASTYASPSIPLRKSLSFGPKHGHATFNTSPDTRVSSLTKRGCHHRDVARDYVKDVLGHPEDSFVVREDSYKDSVTGVEHVYFRQVLYGVEVADGDINLNILNGEVISFGDSFYRGPPPSQGEDVLAPYTLTPTDSQDHAYYCGQLREALYGHMASDAQLPLSAPSTSPYTQRLTQLYEHNCVSLHFIAAAHPSSKASQEIIENFQGIKKGIRHVIVQHLHDKAVPSELLENVPHTESPVKAQLAYVQTPCGENGCADGASSQLNLVWKLEVEMKDNWYEAYIDARLPTRIMSVVDWVSDYSGHDHHEENVASKSKCWPGYSDSEEKLLPVPKQPKKDENGVPEVIYKVWPWGVNDPTEGKRDIVKTPYDEVASPIGWHSIPAAHNPQDLDTPFFHSAKDEMCYFPTTWGNNAQAQENWEGRNGWIKGGRPDGGDNGTYVHQWGAGKKHDGKTVEPKGYIDLAVTQLFYTTNMVHDLYYRYGFDEVAGNFQNYNFGKGGKEDDAVIAQAQDGSGFNNANFATPPDGSRGKMRMYVWDTAQPWRDGDLEAGIVIHELSHGLSTRLTGGPANSGCLGWGESGGMGEGWGDFLATTIRSTSTYQDYAMGAWAANRDNGIRNFVYSKNITVNPSTYKTLDGPGYWGVHAIGEVWAQILWIVEQELIEKHGFTDTLFPPVPFANGTIPENDFYLPVDPKAKDAKLVPKHGNSLLVQLVITGMKLQPCRPSFFDARNAILQADVVLTGGANKCEIWKGFASRGLGPYSKIRGGTPWGGGVRTNDHNLPVECGGKKPGDGDDE